MDNNTKLSSKKYKTLGELLNQDIKIINRVALYEKNEEIKEYLYNYIYIKKYKDTELFGPLSNRVKLISNIACYNYVVKNCFNNKQFIQSTQSILNPKIISFINKLHSIDQPINGIFFDYLIRKFICEFTNTQFYDNRSEDYPNRIKRLNTDVLDKFDIEQNYNIVKTETSTIKIIKSIFITSLSHTVYFGILPTLINVEKYINEIESNKEIFEELIPFIKSLILNKQNILLNPTLGIGDMGADCDLIIDDEIMDIKCCSRDNKIYEILQLLGYCSLYDKKINKISTLNFIKGEINCYNLEEINRDELNNYLNLLLNKK